LAGIYSQTIQTCRPMLPHMKTVRRFLADETGATAIEYGLIAAGIAVVIITVVNGIGTKLVTKFGVVSTSLK
jgi:pilus assembly protein Flp/PilA